MTREERLRELYRVHDHVEEALRLFTRSAQSSGLVADLWRVHDQIERAIIGQEAELPKDVVEALHAE